jgi:hypothetical protein
MGKHGGEADKASEFTFAQFLDRTVITKPRKMRGLEAMSTQDGLVHGSVTTCCPQN